MGPVDGSLTERFFKELEVMTHLVHPNIMKFHECYEDQKRFYLVTELF